MDQEKTGVFIRTMRKQRGLTQEKLGDMLGVTNKTISRWETGRYMPDIDKLKELSAILQVSINELLAGERIEDTNKFIKKADENLVAVLSKNSTFGLQDRIEFFKRKWIKDHKARIFLFILLWGALYFVGICMERPVTTALMSLVGILIYGLLRNQMMIYVEDRALLSESALQIDRNH